MGVERDSVASHNPAVIDDGFDGLSAYLVLSCKGAAVTAVEFSELCGCLRTNASSVRDPQRQLTSCQAIDYLERAVARRPVDSISELADVIIEAVEHARRTSNSSNSAKSSDSAKKSKQPVKPHQAQRIVFSRNDDAISAIAGLNNIPREKNEEMEAISQVFADACDLAIDRVNYEVRKAPTFDINEHGIVLLSVKELFGEEKRGGWVVLVEELCRDYNAGAVIPLISKIESLRRFIKPLKSEKINSSYRHFERSLIAHLIDIQLGIATIPPPSCVSPGSLHRVSVDCASIVSLLRSGSSDSLIAGMAQRAIVSLFGPSIQSEISLQKDSLRRALRCLQQLVSLAEPLLVKVSNPKPEGSIQPIFRVSPSH